MPTSIEKPFLRLVILPADPEVDVVEFGPDFWTWWLEEHEDRAVGSLSKWGTTKLPSGLIALRGTTFGDDHWVRYIGLHRCLGLDMGLIDDAAYFNPNRSLYVFRLTVAVARIWAVLDLYQLVLERFGVPKVVGPWEITLALARTKDAVLGNVAKGWAEPGFGFDPPRCRETALLHHIQIDAGWPDQEGRRSLAYRLGGWIEDSFASTLRRWIQNPQPEGNPLDRNAAQW